MSYAGLHNHSEYSNISTGLDCINHIQDLVDKAKSIGMCGLAITEHDCLSGVIEINRIQKKLRKDNDSFKLAIGNEIYLVDSYDPNDGKREKYYHFILIAKDKIGYDAITQLSSRAWYRSSMKYGKRRIPTLKSDLREIITEDVKGHIIASTACIGGELGQNIINENYGAASDFIWDMVSIFGIDDFYLEMQPSTSTEQIKVNQFIFENRGDVKTIITTDAHYQNKEDFPIFEAFLRSKNADREVKEFYDFARLMDENEVRELMAGMDLPSDFIDEALANTVKIIDSIEFYDLAQKQIVPKVELNLPVPTFPLEYQPLTDKYPTIKWAFETEEENAYYCACTCLNKLWELGKWNEEYLARLEEEFDVFKYHSDQLGSSLFGYFNVIQHYMDIAWSIGDAIGPSRGSASGCLTCYLMGIVQCDPIQYGLYFWRFMNKDRVELPDIDFDSQPSMKPALFEAIRKERGELGLTQVATFRTLTLKAAIGNAGRGYRDGSYPNGLDPDITLYLSSLIEIRRGAVATFKQTMEGDETTGYKVNKNFIKECNQFPGLLDIISKIEGLIVGSSTHASAVLLFDDQDRLLDHCALMRAPNGDLCSALDLHTCEEAGALKYDFLLLSTLDIQTTCFHLLQEDNVIDKNLTLRECYQKYIDPNKIDYTDQRIWDKLYNNEVLSIFQWDAASGRKGILATEPQSLAELTAVNGLIRLMTAEGEEDQIERFVRIKNDPESFEEEMVKAGCSEEQRKIMHDELDRFNGCAATQESFMILSQKLANFTLKEANALRKTVAKKKMSEITYQKDLFFEKCQSEQRVKEYLWNTVVRPSLGYGFSLNHALPYSMIGVQCILMGGILFKPIYWQTACLLQRSGALDNKSADYNKIAKAVSALSQQGVNILPVNINKSEREFKLDAETNSIYFGFLGVKGLKDKAVEAILAERPFTGLADCMNRTKADITSIVALIKAGAFDDFGGRLDHVYDLCDMKSDTKSKLNGQNLLMISRDGFWPKELEDDQKIFNFTQYLKKISKDDKTIYKIDERAAQFLDKIGYPYYGAEEISRAEWKIFYDQHMVGIKNYIAQNQEELLFQVNDKAMQEFHDKYFKGNDISEWEIQVLGLCFGEHPYTNVPNLADFNDMPTEPMPEYFFTTKQGREIPMYRLDMIAGIAIAKDKLHHSITLLTSTGPVEVKFRKEVFAHYDAQISETKGGKKTVIEKSWLNRGIGLLILGMRQDDQFIAKKYKNSPMIHEAYKIIGIDDDNHFEVQKERKTGTEEETIDEE